VDLEIYVEKEYPSVDGIHTHIEKTGTHMYLWFPSWITERLEIGAEREESSGYLTEEESNNEHSKAS
jgi:hypothetical protein